MDESAAAMERASSDGAGAARWLRPLLRVLSPAGARGRLTVLLFHRVHPHPDALFPNEMHAQSFRDCLSWVREGFNVLALDEAVAALARGKLPPRAIAITFDDGYADNATVAAPILRELGIPATFFIATGFLNGGRMFNDTVIEALRRAKGAVLDLSAAGLGRHAIGSVGERRAAIDALIPALKYAPPAQREERTQAVAQAAAASLPDDLMMTSAQVRTLAAAGAIGAHTVNHPILAQLDADAARREISDGRDALEGIVRQPVKLFAYPNGKPDEDYRLEHVRMAKELGFSAAVTTSWGAARTAEALFELPRFTPWDRTPLRFGARLARNLLAPVARATR